MVARRPGQLQEDDRGGAGVGGQLVGDLAEHAEGAAQERALAGLVVLDLLLEVVAGRQFQFEAELVVDGVGLGLQSAVGVEVVAINAVVDRGAAQDGDAVPLIVGDDVAGARQRSADGVVV